MNVAFRLHETARRCTARLARDVLKPTCTCPAAWCFAGIWTAGAIYLAVVGRGDVVIWSFGRLAIWMFFCTITVEITETEERRNATRSRTGRSLLLLQSAVIVLFICLTLCTSLMFYGVVERHPIPVWSPIVEAFGRLGERVFRNDLVAHPALAMANPAQYFLLPLPFLLLLGARFRGLGFRRGHRTLLVVALWCFVPLGVLVYLLACGRLSCHLLIRRLLSHLLINGFGEEFLWRGALQTRLSALLNPSWALVIQAVPFGIWHFGASFGFSGITDGSALIAFCVVALAPAGLAFGIVFQRTRNLWACSAIHVVTNSLAR